MAIDNETSPKVEANIMKDQFENSSGRSGTRCLMNYARFVGGYSNQ